MRKLMIRNGKWLTGAVLVTFTSVAGALETKRVKILEVYPGMPVAKPVAFSVSTSPGLKVECSKVRLPWVYRDDVHTAQIHKQPVRFILSSGVCQKFGEGWYLNALGVILSNDDPIKGGRTKIGAPVDNSRPPKPKKN